MVSEPDASATFCGILGLRLRIDQAPEVPIWDSEDYRLWASPSTR
jgi:hypothetical protein